MFFQSDGIRLITTGRNGEAKVGGAVRTRAKAALYNREALCDGQKRGLWRQAGEVKAAGGVALLPPIFPTALRAASQQSPLFFRSAVGGGAAHAQKETRLSPLRYAGCFWGEGEAEQGMYA